MRNGGWGQFTTCCPCCFFFLSMRTPLTSPVQLWGPSHGRRVSMNFSYVSPFFYVSPFPMLALFPVLALPIGCGSLWTTPVQVPSTGCSPSGTDCSSVGFTTGSQALTVWAPHCMRLQVLPGAWFGMGLAQHHRLFGQPFSGMGSSTGWRWISDPLWTSMGCRSTAVSPWSTWRDAGESLPQILEHLLPLLHCSAELLLSLILTHLAFGCNLLLCCEFFPLLNYVIPEVLPQSPRLSLGQQWVFWSHLALTVTHWGRFWQLLAVDTPVEPIPSAKIWP